MRPRPILHVVRDDRLEFDLSDVAAPAAPSAERMRWVPVVAGLVGCALVYGVIGAAIWVLGRLVRR